MARIGFCGLGAMGAPMATRLVDGGHQVIVWNRTRARTDPLVERGARAAATPAEAARGQHGVVTMLADPAALEEVVFGPDGIAEGMDPGATLIEMSTVGVAAITSLHDRLAEGVSLLDAPVLGSVQPAREGKLKVLVGGEPEVFERWRPVLEVFGTPRHLGPQGSGAAMKLVANSTIGAAAAALGEALALARAFGLEERAVLDTLDGTALGVIVSRARDNLLSGRFEPRFTLGLAAKDLRLVVETAEGVRVPVAEAAEGWFREAQAAGLGDRDYTALIEHVRTAG